MNLEEQVYLQNPQWLSNNYQKQEKDWFHRPYFLQINSWLDKKLAIALTGLRRCGKSTILKQIKYSLEDKNDPKNILYFSFEKSQVKYHPDVLREILNWYIHVFMKTSLSNIKKRVYLFLDEIQYIPYWQDVVKTYYDQSPHLKFFLSGSSSLFIKKKALESLAGRIVEIVIPPLAFGEYLKIKNILQEQNLKAYFKMQKQTVDAYFQEYLTRGQFPEVVKEDYSRQQATIYLDSIEEKVIEQDLPKLYRIERIDILRLIFNFLKNHTGEIIEYRNITGDLGLDLKTVRKYFDYLAKSYLIAYCHNQTKKPIKSARTAKKIYLTSTNFSNAKTGFLAENYVFEFLSQKGEVKFFRKNNFEVDFVIADDDGIFPVEVKYQEKIGKEDYKNLVKLAQIIHGKKAFLITKYHYHEETIQGIKVTSLPISLLEGYYNTSPSLFSIS